MLITKCHIFYHFSIGSIDIVAVLNDYGADVDARDSSGQTPLHVASCYGHVDIVRYYCEV